ncbi:DUF1643 domain-containing protein [Henriciella aquimarina]|uniref:DUF1643 domain-containing protein n=1 Tax=Henriciella aquimarina TaxID=545261 RepID=UPI000A05BC15|nr:DUF1643 domain-containing protein [Henriciella aquimarina]
MTEKTDIRRVATLSDCGNYRYRLGRIMREPMPVESMALAWYTPPRVMAFVMLNPSTADAYEDDPTIRRCVGFARRDDYDEICVMNLFAGRATKPSDLFKMDDPEGPDNREHWQALKKSSATIICAWGADRRAIPQAEKFIAFMEGRDLHCLGMSKDGHPRHPLYLKSETPVEPFILKGATQ